MTPEELRKINLFEALLADAEARGQSVHEPATEDVLSWSEKAIFDYFLPDPTKHLTPLEEAPSFPPASDADFTKWFPGLARSKTQCSAANAEDMYTSEGTGNRRTPSPLLDAVACRNFRVLACGMIDTAALRDRAETYEQDWCRANSAECLAVQPPGRNMRHDEEPLTSPLTLAEALLPIIANQLISAPYAVIGHSVGTWCAYEFLVLARKKGLPMPRIIFLSAMASPDLAAEARPWHRQSELTEEAFKEECRGWDVNEFVFSPAMWSTYHFLMRADFTLFDSYIFQHQSEPPLPCPIVAFHGASDRRISQAMVSGWRQFTSSSFELQTIKGHHLWPLEKASKQIWLDAITQKLAILHP